MVSPLTVSATEAPAYSRITPLAGVAKESCLHQEMPTRGRPDPLQRSSTMNISNKHLHLLAATALATGAGVAATASAMTAQELAQGYQVAALDQHAKAAEGKCGEGKCGADKARQGTAAGKQAEGRCGEGKCGAGKARSGSAKTAGKSGNKAAEGRCGGHDKSSEGSCGARH